MKALNKFLWLCFTCVVNVFYNPCDAYGRRYRILSTEVKSLTKCADITDPVCYEQVAVVNTAIDSPIENVVRCEANQYLVACKFKKNGTTSNELSSCISTIPEPIIGITCETCPEDGILEDTNIANHDELNFWICSDRNILLLQNYDTDFSVELNTFGEKHPYCIRYQVERWELEGKKTVKDCYKPAKNSITGEEKVYTDEKGTFTYSEDCYIDTE